MMGEPLGRQDRLFYEFDLEEMVPGDHLLRRIDAVLDLSWLRGEMKPHYSHIGRPSIDPERMIRMPIVGYVFAIRSKRRLCAEVRVNPVYRWFSGLSIEDEIPDHSAFSRARHERFRESDALRLVFGAAGVRGGWCSSAWWRPAWRRVLSAARFSLSRPVSSRPM